MDEFALIELLTKRIPKKGGKLLRGIGDDSAVIRGDSDRNLILTTDTLVEDIHFRRRWTNPAYLGWKLFHVNASDVAAMGGQPRYFLVSIALPKDVSARKVMSIYMGMQRAAREFGATLVGGDTDATKGKMVLTISMVGEVEGSRCVYRSGAKVGDDIFVTGALGEAAFGLRLLEWNKRGGERFKRKFLMPHARVRWARELVKTGKVHSMIDISDGLLSDLGHIIRLSGVGAKVLTAGLPISKSMVAFCKANGLDHVRLALSGGEDYELLFTAGRKERSVLEKVAKKKGIPLAVVGTVVKGGRLDVLDSAGRKVKITSRGYEHFKT